MKRGAGHPEMFGSKVKEYALLSLSICLLVRSQFSSSPSHDG